MKPIMNNEFVPMTRRYPDLRKKVLERDAKVANKLVVAWDIERDPDKVLSIYLNNINNLSDERYWELLRSVWILCGKVENVPLFRNLMSTNRDKRYYFSTPEEQKKLREMPEVLAVYRATNSTDDRGISWTLSLEYAKWYKETYFKNSIIALAIPKNKVFAYIERNKESEIIIL